MAFKRRAVIVLHLVSGLSLLIFGALLFGMGAGPHVLMVFFGCYAVFSVCIGMSLPVWLNYLVKIFSEEQSISGLATMMIAQNIAKLISSLMILKVVQRYAFDLKAAALVFLAVGGLFVLGSLFFLFTRETADESSGPERRRPPFGIFMHTTIRHMRQNRNFLVFLGSDLELPIVVTVISFYAAYATEFGGIRPAVAAGLFVGLIYAGAIGANFILGTLGWLSLRHKTMVSKSMAIGGVLLLGVWNAPGSFYLASFLRGLPGHAHDRFCTGRQKAFRTRGCNALFRGCTRADPSAGGRSAAGQRFSGSHGHPGGGGLSLRFPGGGGSAGADIRLCLADEFYAPAAIGAAPAF